jgi:hypothetical protein
LLARGAFPTFALNPNGFQKLLGLIAHGRSYPEKPGITDR